MQGAILLLHLLISSILWRVRGGYGVDRFSDVTAIAEAAF
jgi:hypothetical protein